MEPEIVCTAPNGKADGFGILQGGYLFTVSLSLARECVLPVRFRLSLYFAFSLGQSNLFRLLTVDCTILQSLGKILPFEIAVGLNGRVWVHSGNSSHTILISNAILNSEFLIPQQIDEMVTKLYEKMQLYGK